MKLKNTANLSVKSIPAKKHPMHRKRKYFLDKTVLFEVESAPLLFKDIVLFLLLNQSVL